MSDSLASLRDQIDAIDRQLLELLNERAKVAEAVGAVKRQEGSPFSGLIGWRKFWRRFLRPTRGRC